LFDISAVILFGILVGTFSSTYVAAALLLDLLPANWIVLRESFPATSEGQGTVPAAPGDFHLSSLKTKRTEQS
jgi:hypothetical protein